VEEWVVVVVVGPLLPTLLHLFVLCRLLPQPVMKVLLLSLSLRLV
jgi:hypothetical protein